MSDRILFICTGNYYRSRFSELLFNALALDYGVTVRAVSRGLITELISEEMGGLSPHAVRGLEARKIRLTGVIRRPLQVQESDFKEAVRVIAMDEREHRPMMGQRFPHWADRIEYWQVADICDVEPDVALLELENRVRALLESL